MLVRSGQLYLVTLDLFEAEGLDHTWLVGAVGWKYPNAAVVSVDSYTSKKAVVTLKWFRDDGYINEGDTVTSPVEGITLPGGKSPYGTVSSVMPLSAEPTAVSTEESFFQNPYLRVVAALALIGFTAFASWRIGRVSAS